MNSAAGRVAFTLSEVLIAAALGLALMVLAFSLFLRISGSSLLGSSHLELQIRGRETLRRIAPILKLATPPNSQQQAIYAPDVNQTAGNVVFCSPQDLLSLSPPAFNPRAPVYILLQIRFDSSAQELILEDFYTPSRNQVLGRELSQFKVARTHRIGLRLELECQKSVKVGGVDKTLNFQLSDSLQLPE